MNNCKDLTTIGSNLIRVDAMNYILCAKLYQALFIGEK